MIDKNLAIISLVPTATFTVDYPSETVTWIDPVEPPVSEEEIHAERVRLTADAQKLTYKKLRNAEYPPIADYLDGVVKGDQAQIDAYIAACLAVKAKYPKSE